MTAPKSSSPAPAPSAPPAWTRTTILDAVLDGTRAIGPIRQWDTAQWPTHVAGEIADFNARAMVEDRKLHKLIRRTDLFGLYAAGRAIDEAGHRRAPRRARRPATPRDLQRPHRRLRRLGRRQLPEPVRLLPADDRGAAAILPAFGRELAEHREPDVAAAHAAQQRARPRRHPVRPEGHQRLHHQPQRRRPAGGDRGVRGAARTARPTARWRSATTRRSSRRWCSTTTASALLASETLRPFDARARRQPVRRRRGRADARDRGLGRRARRAGAGRSARRRLRVRRRGAARDPRRRRRAGARDPRRRSTTRASRRGRRHDRRARQRHAPVRRVRGRGDPHGVRRRPAAGHRVQVGVRPPDRGRRHRRDRRGARGARQRASCRASRRSPNSIPSARASRVVRAAGAARATVALMLCRGFAGTNAALLVRAA